MNIVNWHKKNDMLPLKVGDYVRVRNDLSLKKTYSVDIVPSMLCFQGIVSRISKVYKDSYELLGMTRDTTRRYRWSKDMLQRVSKKEMRQNRMPVAYDRVRIIPNFSDIAHHNDDIEPEDIDEMDEYAGMSACITDINISDGKIIGYELDVDDGDCWWPPRYIERIPDKEWLQSNDVTMVPGTLVKIREDLVADEQYDNLSVHKEMLKFAGTKALIEKVDYDNTCRLTGTHDNGNFWWTPAMLERIE